MLAAGRVPDRLKTHCTNSPPIYTGDDPMCIDAGLGTDDSYLYEEPGDAKSSSAVCDGGQCGYQDGDPSKDLNAVKKPRVDGNPEKKDAGHAQNGPTGTMDSNRVESHTGLSIQELLEKAQLANENIYAIMRNYSEAKAVIDKKYKPEILNVGVFGNMKQKTKRVAQNAKANKKYQKEVTQLKNKALAKMNIEKKKRDNLMGAALEDMGYEVNSEDYNKAFRFTKARGMLGEDFDYGKSEYDERDLVAGVEGNLTLMEMVLSKLKHMPQAQAKYSIPQ